MTALIDRLRAALTGRYEIRREIAQGGMAIVFEALDQKHDRAVAVKVMRPELASALAADRFLREIRISAGLTHPHILTLIDSGEADGLLFYVTPFAEEPTLRSRLAAGHPLPLAEALSIARDIASALAHAHERGVVHRDIKPDNILMAAGEAIVTDFGIARAIVEAADQRITQTGLAVGTAHYMAPEQAFGMSDARSDIYSLGCTLYEMLAGEEIATVRSTPEARRVPGVLPPIRQRRQDVPEEVEWLLAKATAVDPEERFQTAASLLQALEALTPEGPTAGRARRRARARNVGRDRPGCARDRRVRDMEGRATRRATTRHRGVSDRTPWLAPRLAARAAAACRLAVRAPFR